MSKHDLTTLSGRVLSALDESGLSRAKASRDAGMSSTYVRDLVEGRTREPSSKKLRRLASVLGVSFEWLESGKNGGGRVYAADETTEKRIPEIDIRAGMGGGGEVAVAYVPSGNGGMMETDGVRGNWSLPVDYLRSELRVDTKAARIFEVQGDSMEPTLRSGDRVMVNVADKRPSPPGIFALWDGFGVVVKRIEHIPNSDPPLIRVLSDNTYHREYERTADEVNIIGRVVWYARRL